MSFQAQRGALFENLIISEFLKERFNRGQQADLYFWRDSKGLKVDLLLDDGSTVTPVEIKSGQTIVPDFLRGLNKWRELSGIPDRPALLIHGGETELVNDNISMWVCT